MKTLDVCGLSCPEPVVRALAATKTLSADESLAVLADTATARDNIVRALGKAGFCVEAESAGEGYRIVVSKA